MTDKEFVPFKKGEIVHLIGTANRVEKKLKVLDDPGDNRAILCYDYITKKNGKFFRGQLKRIGR